MEAGTGELVGCHEWQVRAQGGGGRGMGECVSGSVGEPRLGSFLGGTHGQWFAHCLEKGHRNEVVFDSGGIEWWATPLSSVALRCACGRVIR